MPTNEERREVAENLRTMTMCGCHYKEQFYELLEETVMREWDFHSFNDLADRLAEIIEPEPERTCRIDDSGYCDCGYSLGDWVTWRMDDRQAHLYERANFCPKCGARVKEGE